MSIADIVIILIVLAAFSAALTYIIKAKKRGVKCIGCSSAGSCSSKGNPSAGCSCMSNVDEIVQQIKRENQTEKSKKI